MGLLDRFLNRVRMPTFTVGIYGKLPCYKEYFYASGHPQFAELKGLLDQGFERLIKLGAPRPLVCPDRRFYFRMNDPKTDLAGCIFESDDGLRGFPFIMAVPLPARLCRVGFHEAFQVLDPVWRYLEAYFVHLREQRSSADVYNRVIDVIHELEPIRIEPMDPAREPRIHQLYGQWEEGTLRLPLDPEPQGEPDLIADLGPIEMPGMILWPCQNWRSQVPGGSGIYLGRRGLADLDFGLFSNGAMALLHPELEPGENEVMMEDRDEPTEILPCFVLPEQPPAEVFDEDTLSDTLSDTLKPEAPPE